MKNKSLPLEGIRILDLSRVLTGPYATMVMADLGAEVIKVEKPETGDDTRSWGPPFVGTESAYFISANHNKKSITINLKSEQGQQLIYDLAKKCDIVVENFSVGIAKKLNLDYESIEKVNPKIIYTSISGFGQTGPRKNDPGYDIIIQGLGGIMSITGPEPGYKVGVAIDDITAGLFGTIGILSALNRRNRTNKGEYIDISLLDSQVAWLANIASNYLITKEVSKRYGNAHASIVPYQSFEASNTSFILAIGNNKQWEKLCEIIGLPELIMDVKTKDNVARVKNRDYVISILEKIFKEDSAENWLEKFHASKIPAGPVNNLEQALNDHQIRHRDMVVEVEYPEEFQSEKKKIEIVGSPIKLKESPPISYRPPPLLSQHTNEILTNLLNFNQKRIDKLRDDGVI